MSSDYKKVVAWAFSLKELGKKLKKIGEPNTRKLQRGIR